jgi:ribonuclease P/MRP protein subunit RPP1
MSDLCVAWDRSEATQRRALLALQQMGFAAVAWAYEVNGRLGTSHSCQITRPRQEACSAPSSSSFTRPVRQHTRLTVHVEDQLHLSAMLTSRSVLLSYDLVAVVPHSELAFEKCTSPPLSELIDIISLPAGQRAAFPLKGASVRRAVRAGLHFELGYAAALRDGGSRRHYVANLQALMQLLPRQRQLVQGLLLSSGADEARLLRSPHDVANLATLFGCHPTAAAQAVAANAQAVLRRAGRLRAHDPLAPPPASGLFDLEPDSASSSFGTFAALEAPGGGAAVGLAGAAAEAAGAGGDATEPPRQAAGSKKRRKK